MAFLPLFRAFGYLLGSLLIAVPSVSRAQNTLIPLTTRRDIVFDHAGRFLYITTSDGFVRRYNLSTQRLDAAYTLGGSLHGADIAPDDSFLLVPQYEASGSQGVIHKLNLSTGGVTNITYPLTSSEGGGWDIAVASNGTAFLTFAQGYTQIRQINLATNAITSRRDTTGGALTVQSPQAFRLSAARMERVYTFCRETIRAENFSHIAQLRTRLA